MLLASILSYLYLKEVIGIDECIPPSLMDEDNHRNVDFLKFEGF